MAGVKGKSGGRRPGAGRKPNPKPETVVIEGDKDMLALLQDVALGRTEATALQVRAAIAAVQYTHAKKGEASKKGERDDAAREAAKGRFRSAAPPKLMAVK